MKSLIALVFVSLVGCGPQPPTGEATPEHMRHEAISTEREILEYHGPPFFSYDGPYEGRILGYLRDKGTGEMSAHDPHTELPTQDVEVVMFYAKSGEVLDLLVLDGNVIDEVIDGQGRRYFLEMWEASER